MRRWSCGNQSLLGTPKFSFLFLFYQLLLLGPTMRFEFERKMPSTVLHFLMQIIRFGDIVIQLLLLFFYIFLAAVASQCDDICQCGNRCCCSGSNIYFDDFFLFDNDDEFFLSSIWSLTLRSPRWRNRHSTLRM